MNLQVSLAQSVTGWVGQGMVPTRRGGQPLSQSSDTFCSQRREQNHRKPVICVAF
jgi:hypothetical protein